VSFGAGLAAFAVSLLATPWETAALIGWNVAATVFIVWVWLIVRGMDGEATARHAVIEDLSRGTADLVLILASVISLIGVGLSLLEASNTEGFTKALVVGVASVSVILSWATVHMVFTLRYARLYYAAGGGIDFNDDRDPPRLPGLRVPRVHDRDDVPGLGHVDRLEGGSPNGPAPRLHVVPVRDRHRGDDDQRRRGPLPPLARRERKATSG